MNTRLLGLYAVGDSSAARPDGKDRGTPSVLNFEQEKRHTRLRLVLNRQGIKRIEHIHV